MGKIANWEQLREYRKILKKVLSKSRYEHVLGVEFTSASLAMRYGASVQQAQLAGLMHDCAKYLSEEELLEECDRYKISVTEAEKRSPYLLHGKVGACYCKIRYEIEDPEILSAIIYHTTGKPAMSILEKIVYVADYIEPKRDKAPNLELIRRMAFIDLDEAIYLITRDILAYLKEDGSNSIDGLTKETFDYYKRIHDTKKE